MGRSAKVARLGNFATHKKNVRRRVLVEKKKPKPAGESTPQRRATDARSPKGKGGGPRPASSKDAQPAD